MLQTTSSQNNLDRINVRIVSNLHQNGRITKLELSDRVGLSATPCWERMKRLEKSGIIRGYHADVDLSKIIGVSYFRVEIKLLRYSAANAQKFIHYIRSIPELVECDAVLGSVDFKVKIVACNVGHYQRIIEMVQLNSPAEFEYTTFPVSRCIKGNSDIEIQTVFDALTDPRILETVD